MDRIREAVRQYRDAPFRSADWLANEIMSILDTGAVNDNPAALSQLRERAHELSMALMPFALMTGEGGRPAAEGYHPSVIMRFEASAGEMQFARETLAKWSPQLFDQSAPRTE